MSADQMNAVLRAAAFEQVRRLQVTRDQLTAVDLTVGFFWNGTRFPLINPQRGIFKPRQMALLLSIRTVFPRSGNRVWYDDQRQVHKQIYEGDDTIDYAFMGTLRLVKQRLHQSTFRQAVIDAYRTRCALSGVPEPLLLDAAHIISDGNEKLGQPVVQKAFRYLKSTMPRLTRI